MDVGLENHVKSSTYYRRAAELDGVVPGPKTLGTFRASYLYGIFQRLGVIKK